MNTDTNTPQFNMDLIKNVALQLEIDNEKFFTKNVKASGTKLKKNLLSIQALSNTLYNQVCHQVKENRLKLKVPKVVKTEDEAPQKVKKTRKTKNKPTDEEKKEEAPLP